MSVIHRRRRDALHRLLLEPTLPRLVRELPAPALGMVIGAVGVEDAAELLAFATTDQLTHLFDEDVFDADDLDPERFAVWLEVLLELGEAPAADRVNALPEALVVGAFRGHLAVFELECLGAEIGSDPSLRELNDSLERAPSEEILGYLVVSLQRRGGSAIWETLLALAERHPDDAESLLARLCDATSDRVARDGLTESLSAEERAPKIYDARMDELAFLANVLSADAAFGERPRRAIEAADEALEVCGMALMARSPVRESDADVLAERALDLLYREGARC